MSKPKQRKSGAAKPRKASGSFVDRRQEQLARERGMLRLASLLHEFYDAEKRSDTEWMARVGKALSQYSKVDINATDREQRPKWRALQRSTD